MRYTDFWSIHDALRAQTIFQDALRVATGSGAAFTLLDDLREWGPQAQEVVELNKQFVTLCRKAPISRNAMVIPRALLRIQIHRTLDGMENCRVFETFEEADEWLGEVESSF
ncbi:hypothetical protein [Sphingobium cloacae]|nr:hypothetical protein [Sphingobium cloacae]